MIRFFTALLLLALVLGGCSKSQPPQPVVVLDSWWNVDYAKNWCNDSNPCTSDPVVGVNEFERDLITQFASQEACHSVKVLQLIDPKSADSKVAEALSNEHWNLSINFTVDKPSQEWQMVNLKKSAEVLKGNGTPSEIVKNVCNILTNKGGQV